MRLIRNWYKLLEGTGLAALDSGPGQANGALRGDVTWCPYYYPPGTQLGYKGVTVGASQSRIVSGAAEGFPADSGSIEMLVRPTWSYDDGEHHFLWDTYGGPNKRFFFYKADNNTTRLWTNDTARGSFTFPWAADTLYHIALNWGTNQLYINGVLEKTFDAGGLGLGASTLYIGDQCELINRSFSGNIYYFIARDVPLTVDEVKAFRALFENQYIP